MLLDALNVHLEDPHKVVKVVASDGKSGEQKDLSYTNCKVIGNGSFGVVFQAKVISAPKGEDEIAIKKVLQDKRFKVRSAVTPSKKGRVADKSVNSQNRELQIMRLVSHPNVVELKAFFYSNGESKARPISPFFSYARLRLVCSRRMKCI